MLSQPLPVPLQLQLKAWRPRQSLCAFFLPVASSCLHRPVPTSPTPVSSTGPLYSASLGDLQAEQASGGAAELQKARALIYVQSRQGDWLGR